MISVLVRGIILGVLAIFFNGEFLAHGSGLFSQGILLIFYFLFVSFLDRTRAIWGLKNHQIALIGASIGLFIEGFFPRSLYGQYPSFLGISVLVVLAQGLAYGFFATLLPIYYTQHYFKIRELTERKNKILFFTFLVSLVILLLVWWQNLKPLWVPQSILILFISIFIFFLAFHLKEKNFDTPKVKKVNRVLFPYLLLQTATGFLFPQYSSLFYGLSMLFFGTIFFFLFFVKPKEPLRVKVLKPKN